MRTDFGKSVALGIGTGLLVPAFLLAGNETEIDVSHGHRMVTEYFDSEIETIRGRWLEEVDSAGDFDARARLWRGQLATMLGLDPWPERTPLNATVTGTIERHEAFTVEKVHFESQPGLYVTGNLYIPRDIEDAAPGVLYLPGHTRVIEGGVSYGPKTADHYQNHPAWYARHGMVCLIIDTLHAGEIRGIHHGPKHYGRWWWYNRGYTPTGVELWNAVRALDYLESRPEVDGTRLAVTGMSGGGGLSWHVMALDERPVTSVPTAGITDLRSYVVDERVAPHCDCMLLFNRYRWDYSQLAALGAPRPVMLASGDSDHLFPTDGIERLDREVTSIYDLLGAAADWRLFIRPGGHTQGPFRAETYRWMHERLHGRPIEDVGDWEAFFGKEELRVFGDELPPDERNTRIDEEFVTLPATPDAPENAEDWSRMRRAWRDALMEKTFVNWPDSAAPLELERAGSRTVRGLRIEGVDFNTHETVRLRAWRVFDASVPEALELELRLLDDADWQDWLALLQAGVEDPRELVGPGAEATPWPDPAPEAFEVLREQVIGSGRTLVFFAPRGVGPSNWLHPDAPRDPLRRSFAPIGQTRDLMRVWDARRAAVVAREGVGSGDATLTVRGRGAMAGIALYAGLFDDGISRLHLEELPSNHREGPILFNVRRVFDIPQALAMAADRVPVVLEETGAETSAWAMRAMSNIGRPDRIRNGVP